MRHERARLGLLAAVVAVGVVVPGGTGVAGAVAAPDVLAGPTVTLLTGDKVTVGGMYGVRVRAAQGREQISFFTRTDEQGDTHVVPEDAVALLSQGKLDPRLFDVSELVRVGYDDASRDRLPLIVDYPGRTPRMAGVQVGRELPSVSATAVSVDRSATAWPTLRDAEHVWLDGPVQASLDQSVPQIGAPEAWAAGHTGAGATVAVLDTGIDATHPELSDAIVGTENFTYTETADDGDGHGTHVASTITGNGDRYQGVAPDAKLLVGKVLDDFGGGTDSWIIAGMEWAAANGADVINMSLGSALPSDGTDPMSQAVNRLTAETGALFVIAAGNSGDLIGSPGAADAALTVGSVDKSDQLAPSSSRGRTDGAIKPDITAPGVDIVAAKAKNGHRGEPVDEGHVMMSGTSMATPHVAGAAAILAGQHPDWTADRLKAGLMGTARPNDTLTVFEQGAGRVDVAKATTSTVFASAGSLNLGTALWPHDDDQAVTKTVTYTNTGTSPVTLDLALDITGPSAVPAGMFTVEPARLTVPAGGQATATVTADTRVDAADGLYGGALTATGGDLPVRTPVAVNREVESYDVTVKFVDANGAPTDLYWAQFVNVDNPRKHYPYDPSGTVVVRLPKGEYFLDATVQTPDGEFNFLNARFAEPAFMVTGDASVVLDARAAKPVGFTVDKPNARTGSALLDFVLETAWGEERATDFVPDLDDVRVMPATTVKKDKFTFVAQSRMAEWNGESFNGTPYLYNVRHTENGTVPPTLQWRVRDTELAVVRSEHAVDTPGMRGIREFFLLVPLPGTLTEYYTPDVPWDALFEEVPESGGAPVVNLSQIEPQVYRLGRPTTVRWNFGVYGPALPKSPYREGAFAGRVGDYLGFAIPMVTDQGRGRGGFVYDEGSTTLLRDGEVVGEEPYGGSGVFRVGPERAEYILRTTQSRPAARHSTQISAEWTFTSEHSEELVASPMLALRFAPNLDDHNSAPAGKRYTIPMFVERNGTDEVGRVNTPALEVSYDDGTTWQRAKVTRDHGDWKATVNHPAGAEFVSLRSTVADPSGSTQHLTIIRAYSLR